MFLRFLLMVAILVWMFILVGSASMMAQGGTTCWDWTDLVWVGVAGLAAYVLWDLVRQMARP